MPLRWRAVGNHVSSLTGRDLNLTPSDPVMSVLPLRQKASCEIFREFQVQFSLNVYSLLLLFYG